MMQLQHKNLIKLNRQFVSFETEQRHCSFLENLDKDIINSTNATLPEVISTSLGYLQSVNGADKSLLRNQLACAFTKKWFSGGCIFIVAYIVYRLRLAIDSSENVAFASFYQPELFVKEAGNLQGQLSGQVRGVFGSNRPKIIILPYCKAFGGKAEVLVVEMPSNTAYVPDAPLVFLELALDNAQVLYRHEITDSHSHFFDLLILQCSLLLGLINEASEAAFDYATKRHSFGKPIIQHQLVADRAADCIIRITSHDLALQKLIYEYWKNGSSAIMNNFADFIESLITASHETMRDAMQTFGAASIVEDHPNVRNSYEQARLFSVQLSEAVGKL